MSDLTKLMKLTEETIDGYHYSHNNGYEILIGEGQNIWRLRKINKHRKGLWRIFTSNNVVSTFKQLNLDLQLFQAKVTQNLISKSIHYKNEINKIEKLLDI